MQPGAGVAERRGDGPGRVQAMVVAQHEDAAQAEKRDLVGHRVRHGTRPEDDAHRLGLTGEVQGAFPHAITGCSTMSKRARRKGLARPNSAASAGESTSTNFSTRLSFTAKTASDSR